MPRLFAGALLFTLGCMSPGTPQDSATMEDDVGDIGELPPMGNVALTAWLAEGHYLAWACEAEAHPARPPGAHGANRICSNAALSASEAGTFPIGAASVKELYSGGSLSGYAVGRKLTAGTERASWYWYEKIGTSVVADSAGAGLCAGCHEDATRDHVFTQVR
ncbi:MAG: hypothetical protein H0T46_08705 [Deltaproteobacteria bacterium]|nr:hypothetical protein [Deltaproteobacteria bacterium]